MAHEESVAEEEGEPKGDHPPRREPTAFGRFVLARLEERGQSLRGLARAAGVSFDRLSALLYGRPAHSEKGGPALGSTFLLPGLYAMAGYLGVEAIELLSRFYGRERETEARAFLLLDGFFRLDEEGQLLLLRVVESLSSAHSAPLSEEVREALSHLSLGRSPTLAKGGGETDQKDAGPR